MLLERGGCPGVIDFLRDKEPATHMVQRRCIIGAARQKIKADRECWDGERAALAFLFNRDVYYL